LLLLLLQLQLLLKLKLVRPHTTAFRQRAPDLSATFTTTPAPTAIRARRKVTTEAPGCLALGSKKIKWWGVVVKEKKGKAGKQAVWL
jgi:hypothetical protein